MALLNNSNGQVQIDAEVVDGTVTAAIEALTTTPGVEGGRQIKGQMHVLVDPGVTEQGVSKGWFSDGTIPVAYSDGTIPSNVYAAGSATPSIDARIDLTVTIHDLAFEEFDAFGGKMTPQERNREANKS